jgi:ABC-type multidrug transport system ATPase subunit/ABC-type multidrug transport system permease subunit
MRTKESLERTSASSTSEEWEEVDVDDTASIENAEVGCAFRLPRSRPSKSSTSVEPPRLSPFATRQGKTLWFRNVYMEVPNHSRTNLSTGDAAAKDERVVILNGCWGSAPAGQVTSILGSSGSGKTSLLNVLSGRQVGDPRKSQVNKCQVKLNGEWVDPSSVSIRKQIAFVSQDDFLQVTATPREAILFSARLRLPRSTPAAEIRQLAKAMIEELRLKDCANTLIGSSIIKGVSGGERKRTAVGVELVTQPSLVFLDEPTSGLDSYNASELVSVLKRVAQAGSTVLLTIHQPSSEIFSALDNLIQLERGEVLYGGRVQDVPGFFEQRGFPCPPHYNPADWIVNVAQTTRMDDLRAKGFFVAPEDSNSSHQSNNGDLRRRKSSAPKLKPLTIVNNRQFVDAATKETHPGFFVQTKLLFMREVHNLHRNTRNLVARTAMTVVGSVLGGIFFFQVGKSSFTDFINLQSTFGGLLMSLLANVFSTALPSLVAFPEERPVFLREYSTNHYSVAAYFASHLIMEAIVTASQALISTILTYFLMGLSVGYGIYLSICYVMAMTSTALGVLFGCSVKEPDVAVEFLPLLFMPQILFSGFFIPPDLIPVWLRWLQYIFPLTYAVRLVMVAEFDNACNGLEPNYCDSTFRKTFSWPFKVPLSGRSSHLLCLTCPSHPQ